MHSSPEDGPILSTVYPSPVAKGSLADSPNALQAAKTCAACVVKT